MAKFTFSPSSKLSAVRRALEPGCDIAKLAAEELGVRLLTLRKWIRLYEEDPEIFSLQRSKSELDRENARLIKEIAETKMETEILKKFAEYSGKK
ncbi:MAG: transposase [Candidatus Wallbacteria bacterium]|nr:transposase [Candidatus Wallbacteria bacterium]